MYGIITREPSPVLVDMPYRQCEILESRGQNAGNGVAVDGLMRQV